MSKGLIDSWFFGTHAASHVRKMSTILDALKKSVNAAARKITDKSVLESFQRRVKARSKAKLRHLKENIVMASFEKIRKIKIHYSCFYSMQLN